MDTKKNNFCIILVEIEDISILIYEIHIPILKSSNYMSCYMTTTRETKNNHIKEQDMFLYSAFFV